MLIKKLILITLVLSMVLLIGCQQPDECKWNSFKPDESHYLICVNGCSEMYLIFEEKFNISKDQLKQHLDDLICLRLCMELVVKKELTKNEEKDANP